MDLKNRIKERRKNLSDNNTPAVAANISGPLIFTVLIIAIIFLMSIMFRVSVIDVFGNKHYTKEEIINAVDIEEGDNLFFFDRFAAVSRVFAKLPYVEEVSVSRRLPNRVEITLTESSAMAYLTVGDEKWTIDHKCKILGKVAEGEESTLIEVSGISPGTLLIGEDLTTESGESDTVEFLAAVLEQIQDRGMTSDVSSIDFSNTSKVSFDYTEKYHVIIGDAFNVEYKFGMMLSAISQLLPDDVGTIDLSDATRAFFTPA